MTAPLVVVTSDDLRAFVDAYEARTGTRAAVIAMSGTTFGLLTDAGVEIPDELAVVDSQHEGVVLRERVTKPPRERLRHDPATVRTISRATLEHLQRTGAPVVVLAEHDGGRVTIAAPLPDGVTAEIDDGQPPAPLYVIAGSDHAASVWIREHQAESPRARILKHPDQLRGLTRIRYVKVTSTDDRDPAWWREVDENLRIIALAVDHLATDDDPPPPIVSGWGR